MGDFSVFITNLGKFNEGELCGMWIDLPIDKEELEKVFVKIGIDNVFYEEYFLTDWEMNIQGLSSLVCEYSSITELNKIADCLQSLSSTKQNLLETVLEYEQVSDFEELEILIDQLDQFDFYEGITNCEALGLYYAEELCCIEIPDHLEMYFDYEKYGEDMSQDSLCMFTKNGFLVDYR